MENVNLLNKIKSKDILKEILSPVPLIKKMKLYKYSKKYQEIAGLQKDYYKLIGYISEASSILEVVQHKSFIEKIIGNIDIFLPIKFFLRKIKNYPLANSKFDYDNSQIILMPDKKTLIIKGEKIYSYTINSDYEPDLIGDCTSNICLVNGVNGFVYGNEKSLMYYQIGNKQPSPLITNFESQITNLCNYSYINNLIGVIGGKHYMIFDFNLSKSLCSFEMNGELFCSIKITDDDLVGYYGESNEVAIYSIKKKVCTSKLQDLKSFVSYATVLEKNKILAVSDCEGNLNFYKTEDIGKSVIKPKKFKEHQDNIIKILESKNGDAISFGDDGLIVIYDLEKNNVKRKIQEFTQAFSACYLLNNGDIICSELGKLNIKILSQEDGHCIFTFEGISACPSCFLEDEKDNLYLTNFREEFIRFGFNCESFMKSNISKSKDGPVFRYYDYKL